VLGYLQYAHEDAGMVHENLPTCSVKPGRYTCGLVCSDIFNNLNVILVISADMLRRNRTDILWPCMLRYLQYS
jgi:hypothetical protein